MATSERDFFIEVEDAKRVTSRAMAAIVARLPASCALTPAELGEPLALSAEAIRGYIEDGSLVAIRTPPRHSGGKAVYRIPREEALAFIKKHLTT